MGTYYKYVEKDTTSQVNWADVSADLIESIKGVTDGVQAKRKAVDEASKELSEFIMNTPSSEHKGMNEFASNFANQAQEQRLLQDKMLKSGQISLREYNISRANLTQGTEQLFGLSEKFSKKYEAMMAGIKDGTLSQANIAQKGITAAFQNFTDSAGYINPMTGKVSVGRLTDQKIDGKDIRTLDKTPGGLITAQQMNASLDQNIEKWQIDAFNEEITQWEQTYQRQVGLTNIEDLRGNPEFEEAKTDFINSVLAKKDAAISIMFDYMKTDSNGQPFEFTNNPDDVDSNTILLIPNPNDPGSGYYVPDFNAKGKELYHTGGLNSFKNKEAGDEFRKWVNDNYPEDAEAMKLDVSGSYNNSNIQKAIDAHGKEYVSTVLSSKYSNKENMEGVDVTWNLPSTREVNYGEQQEQRVKDFLNNQLEIRLGKKIDKKTSSTTATQTRNRQNARDNAIAINNISDLAYGNDTEFQVSAAFLQGQNSSITEIDKKVNANGEVEIMVSFNDGITKTFPITSDMTPEQFVISVTPSIVPSIKDINEAIKSAEIGEGLSVNPNKSNYKINQDNTNKNEIDNIGTKANYIESLSKLYNFKGDNQNFIEDYKSEFYKLGLNVVKTGRFSNKVQIKQGDDVLLTFDTKVDNKEKIKGFLENYLDVTGDVFKRLLANQNITIKYKNTEKFNGQ